MTCDVLEFARQYGLFDGVGTLCVGVSGGKDSVCLLDILVRLQKDFGYTLTVVHVNHGLRGENAARDEAFVQELCASYGLPCVVVHADVRLYAKEQGIGLEESGRAMRYQAFFAQNCDAVAVAHTLSDNVETSLFHLARGTSLKGAAGMEPKQGKVIRPLLCCTRSDVNEYIEKHSLNFVSDETNDEDTFARNYIRHHIVPAFQSRNPSFERDYARFMQSASLQQDFLRQSAFALLKGAETAEGYLAAPFAKAHPALRREALAVLLKDAMQKQTETRHIDLCEQIILGGKGQICIANDLYFSLKNDIIMIRNAPKESAPFCVPFEHGIAKTPYGVYTMQTDPAFGADEANALDADLLEGVLILRSRLPGDRLSLVNREGGKTLKKWFNEQKLAPEARSQVAVLTADDRIAWVEGIGADRAFCAQKTTKRKIWIIKTEDES